jgi:hypothetical protein
MEFNIKCQLDHLFKDKIYPLIKLIKNNNYNNNNNYSKIKLINKILI